MSTNALMKNVEKWDVFELVLTGTKDGNPYIDVSLEAKFEQNGKVYNTHGFYDGNGVYKVRFMPNITGIWSFATKSSEKSLDGLEGQFCCVDATSDNHGPVRVKDTFHFAYEDGTFYYPIGTTCYAWTHQSLELEEQTLTTLAASPFNKMRMCIFPKHYDYNHNEPLYYPFEGTLEKGWDFTRFNPEFFAHLELRLIELRNLGIEADLILFHPYDKWGFAKMGAEADDLYIRYIVARLASFRNVWWSLANEYDLMGIDIPGRFVKSKSEEDWERFAEIIVKTDPYQHLRSIHNCFKFYDHTREWITHCSIQRVDVYKTSENTNEWRVKYNKPIVIDECAYEGDINHGWGNITGEEMVRRFWEGTVRGGYVGHGETYLNAEEILWWSKGGNLSGQSHQRIAFLRKILEDAPSALSFKTFGMASWDLPCGAVQEDYYLFYFGFNQPSFRTFDMPKGNHYKVDVIDTWNMTIDELEGIFEGDFRVKLPARQFIAVRMRRVGKDF